MRGFARARQWFGPTRTAVEKTFREAFEGEWPALSVIVAARNEEAVIDRLLDAMARQTYERFELIVVDDGSTDDTAVLVEERAAGDDRIRLIRQDQAGKKAAIHAALSVSAHPVCVFTDADCTPGPDWLAAHARAHGGPGASLVVGYSPLEGPASWLVRFQQFDTTLNQFLAASAIGDGKAYMARGGNLSYARALHDQAGGFEAHVHHISGDDTLFIQAVRRQTD
ncbi:MAG: glycosyltransferase, partial [Rhodothermales bacterium]